MFLATPMLAELATLNSYLVELPLTAYSFLALSAFLLLRRAESPAQRWRCAALCGVMAGLAFGCKYPAALFVVAPVVAFVVACGIVRPATLWRSLGEAVVIGAVAVAAASPWLVRNAVNTGNPTYPLLYHTFGAKGWTPQQDAKFAKAHRAADARLMELARPFFAYAFWRHQPGKQWEAPWRPPASPLLFLFALVPIALADPRSTFPILCLGTLFLAIAAYQRLWPGELQVDILLAGSVLALVTAPAFLVNRGDVVFLPLHFVLWLIAWYTLTHRLDRFLDPATPAVALLAGVGVVALGGGRLRRAADWLLVGGLGYALATTVLIHAGPLWAGLATPTDEFLKHAFAGSTYCQPAMEIINRRLPPDATVLFVGEARTFYCTRRAIAATVFDRHPLVRILAEGGPGEPTTRVRDGLRRLGVTHLYVNWQEIRRLGSSYAYRFDGRLRDGFTDRVVPGPGQPPPPDDDPARFLTPQLFSDLLAAGHLRTVAVFGGGPPRRGLLPDFVLYELVGGPPAPGSPPARP